MAMDEKRLDWLEKAGIENMKAHYTCADALAKEAATTLTVLLAGIGGGLAYASKAAEQGKWTALSIGATAFTTWLIGVAWYLVTKALMLEAIPQVYNEPKNLDDPNEDLNYLKECELLSLQQRIDDAASRNGKLAMRLNRARRLAIASPLVFLISLLAWRVVAYFATVPC